MPQTVARRSPVHHLLGTLGAQSREEEAALQTVALCDVSTLPKLGVKGPGAEAFLRGQGLEVPPTTYDMRRLADGTLIARLGASDFFLEGSGAGDLLPRLSTELDRAQAQVYRVERQDAAFVLAGVKALNVLAQLCSIDFRSGQQANGRLLLTRAGGINCTILPGAGNTVPYFRLWVDYTFGVSFWETLAEISGELGGRVVGAVWLCPLVFGAQTQSALRDPGLRSHTPSG